jgi:hypothetical protein
MVKPRVLFVIRGVFENCGSSEGFFTLNKDGVWGGRAGAKKYRFKWAAEMKLKALRKRLKGRIWIDTFGV